jgi:tripartite-type tricarboxylate transporter receptor subunit TctC
LKTSWALRDIATEAVVCAMPDGYTLLVVLAANAIKATLHQKLRFSPVRDLAMVTGMVRVLNVMEMNPAVLANTVAEFIAYAKQIRVSSVMRRAARQLASRDRRAV